MIVGHERRAAERASCTIARPGHNCWRVDRAARFACVQDAAAYFRLVRHAILQARETVFIVGWDIQATIDLVPEGAADAMPTRLDELLKFVVRRRPSLRCYVLIWDHAALYTLERDPLSRWRLGWRMPRQVRFGFDDHHPVAGSHHQKIVVVDDELAFCGGIDLTGHRWDTAAHRVEEPARVNAVGSPYGPYHEVQAMLCGPAAASLGALVRDRWRTVGEDVRPRASNASRDLWPAAIEPDLIDVDVAIARTMPPSEREPGVRECEQLFLDSIAAAERSLYIESQYFTNDTLGEALAARLREPDGPEVIAVVPKECHGWLEQQTMGALRGEVFRALLTADRHRRLRIVYPEASRRHGVATFVHSKVMIVDDRVVRIGSANVSRRSMGVDTECDVAAEVGADARGRSGVRRIRDRLLAEHLGLSLDAVAQALGEHGSLCALVDAHTGGDHTLLRVDLSLAAPPPADVVKEAADPAEPIGVGTGVSELIPPLDARADRGSVRLWLPAVAILAATLVLARVMGRADALPVRELLESVPLMPGAFTIGVTVFLFAHFALIPLELVAVLSGVIVGGSFGLAIAVAGACAAAAIGYVAGRAIGPLRLARWMSRRAYRSTRQLGTRGMLGVAVLRLTSMASGGSVHLICGAARVPFMPYFIGSVLGLTPVAVVLSGVGSLVRTAILEPGWGHGIAAVGGVLGAWLLAFGVRALLLLRQFSPSVARQRERAEFG